MYPNPGTRWPLFARLAIALLCGLAITGCISRTYRVGETDFGLADEEWQVLMPQIKSQKPDEVIEKSPNERLLIFYSGKMLLTGSAGTPSKKEKERMIVKERDGQMILWHRTVQYIEVRNFGCGNISGHGSFCATEVYRECELWSTHVLRIHCPSEVGVPLQ
jgi:hypothetical protein